MSRPTYPSWKGAGVFVLLSGLAVVAVFAARERAADLRLLYDEYSILIPAMGLVLGKPLPLLHYPDFVYLFYSLVFRASPWFVLLTPENLLDVARFANHLLFALNIFLFFAILRRTFRPFYAFLGVVLFAFSPAVFYTGAVIKPDSLVLTEVLLSLLVAQRVAEEPGAIRWHALAALLSGLAVSTRYNPIPMTAWFLAWTAGEWKGFSHARGMARAMLFSPRLPVFAAVFALTVLIFGKNIVFGERPAWFTAGEAAYLPYPNFLRSVPGWRAFPYGRWSYSLVIVIPFAVGLWNLLAAAAAMAWEKMPRRFLWVFGVSLVPYILAITLYTWMKASWLFSYMPPFIIMAGLFLYRGLLEKSGSPARRAAGLLAVFTALGMTALQYSSNLDMIAGITRVAQGISGPDAQVKLITNAGVKKQGLDPGHPARDLLAQRPESVLILDAYAFNFGKYPKGSDERKEGDALKELMAGKLGYEVRKKIRLDFFRFNMTVDPEASMTYYHLVRKS